MSTSEEIPLQSADGKEAEAGIQPESLEQDDTADTIQDGSKGKAPTVTVGRWMKLFIAVMSLIAFALLTTGISMITPFYPIVAEEHNVPSYVAGFVIGIAALFVTVLSPVIGYFLPQLGVKFTQLAGLLWGGGALFLFGFVSLMSSTATFITFSFLLRIVEGVGTAMYSTVAYTQLIDFYPEKKGTVVAFMQFANAVGYTVGPTIGGGLQQVGGFVLPFAVVGGCIISMMVLLTIVLPSTECHIEMLPWRLVLKLLTSPMFLLLVVTLIVLRTAGAGVFAFYGQYLFTEFNLSVGIIGAIYFAVPVTYGIGTISVGPLTDRLIPRCLTVGGMMIVTGACLFVGPAEFITSPTLWVSIVAWVFLGAGRAIATVPFYADMSRVAKNFHEDEAAITSTLSGILVGCFSGGQFLGPIISGALVYQVHFRWMATIIAFMVLFAALVLVAATGIQKVWNYYCQKRNKNSIQLQ